MSVSQVSYHSEADAEYGFVKDVTEGVLEKLDMSDQDLERLEGAQLNSHAISLSCIR
jgi:hypothetical protein